MRGWRDELAGRGLPVVDLVYGDWTAAGGYRIGLEMDLEPGMAIFASNDLMALGLMSALRERSLSVPDDISLVGFDDIPEAAYLYPPLTTVRQDFAALGELMLQKVLVALEEGDHETDGHAAADAPGGARVDAGPRPRGRRACRRPSGSLPGRSRAPARGTSPSGYTASSGRPSHRLQPVCRTSQAISP